MATRTRLFSALTLGAGLAAVTDALSAPVPTLAASTTCDSVCQAEQQQQANALPRPRFYDAPRPLSLAPAGTLIRSRPTNAYRVGGTTVRGVRILYHSRTSTGADVAVSGVVLTPKGTPPAGGWPIVADAHGSSGIGVPCAPSLMRDLYHGDQMLRFVQRGWAVVATDYAGLGTDGRTEFLDKAAEANDVINAVRAAQTRLPLASRWVVWGNSQGGGAALAIAERQAVRRLPGYLGAVVTSPAADLRPTVRSIVATPGVGGFMALIAQGASTTDPRIDLSRLLTAAARARLDITSSGCLGVVLAAYGDLSGAALAPVGYLHGARFARFLSQNSSGTRPVGRPILLLQGDAYVAVPPSITDSVAARMCRRGARLDYRTYPGLGHDTIPGLVTGIDDGAMEDILRWSADRFAGRPAPAHCP
jgi:alpha-beta hydrolase superfamily lysophospholipase